MNPNTSALPARCLPPSTRFLNSDAGLYAVRLEPLVPGHHDRIAGRVEHVLSGRRHLFDDGAALLACLLLESLTQAGDAA